MSQAKTADYPDCRRVDVCRTAATGQVCEWRSVLASGLAEWLKANPEFKVAKRGAQ